MAPCAVLMEGQICWALSCLCCATLLQASHHLHLLSHWLRVSADVLMSMIQVWPLLCRRVPLRGQPQHGGAVHHRRVPPAGADGGQQRRQDPVRRCAAGKRPEQHHHRHPRRPGNIAEPSDSALWGPVTYPSVSACRTRAQTWQLTQSCKDILIQESPAQHTRSNCTSGGSRQLPGSVASCCCRAMHMCHRWRPPCADASRPHPRRRS